MCGGGGGVLVGVWGGVVGGEDLRLYFSFTLKGYSYDHLSLHKKLKTQLIHMLPSSDEKGIDFSPSVVS